MSAVVTYRCVRSWDRRELTFAHPDGRPAEAWDYEDGRIVMELVIQTIVFDPQPQRFSIFYEHCDGDSEQLGALRRFVVRTARGTVTLEPLPVSYAATFGMCGVFADRLSRRDSTAAGPQASAGSAASWTDPSPPPRRDAAWHR